MSMEETSDEGIHAFCKRLSDVTVRILSLDGNGHPASFAGSGMLWQPQERLTLLSVGHVFKKPGRVVDAGVRYKDGVLMLPIGEPGQITAEAMISADGALSFREVDFAYAHLDKVAIRKALPGDLAEFKYNCYRGPLTLEPDRDHVYGFAAWILSTLEPQMGRMHMRQAFEVGMTFDGVQQEGDYAGSYRFLLVREHQGHAYYKGASGSPIADETSRIVALVRGGDAATGVIFGCPLKTYSRHLH